MKGTNNIKEFVAYEFKDINDEILSKNEIDWVPVLFPYNKYRNTYFITLTFRNGGSFNQEKRKIFRDICSEEVIIYSVYDVCGYNPLFVIAEAKNPNNLKITLPDDAVPRYMSIAAPENCIKRFGIKKEEFGNIIKDNDKDENYFLSLERSIKNLLEKQGKLTQKSIHNAFKNNKGWEKFVRFVPMNMKKVISIILINPPIDRNEKNKLINKILDNPQIIDAYEIFGESKLLVKIITNSVFDVYRFVYDIMSSKAHTITKTVLSTHIENGLPFARPKTPMLESSLDDMQKRILRYLWKEIDFRTTLASMIEDFRENFMKNTKSDKNTKLGYSYLESEFRNIEKEYIYKYSVKLDRKGWFRALLFIKSSLMHIKKLWESINKYLLGVDKNYFARKLYAITGDFDFIVPVDCYELMDLNRKIEKFLDEKTSNGESVKKYVKDIRAYFEKNTKEGKLLKKIKTSQIAAVQAMMPNAKIIGVSRTNKGSMREICFNYYLNSKTRNNMINYLIGAGAEKSVELHSEKLVHVFIRFDVDDIEGFDEELNNLEENPEHLFLLREYNPIHSPYTRMFILTTENFESLINFISALDKYSKNTAISLIFTQDFFKPSVPPKYRCKPCKLPVGQLCDACEQYIEKREKTDIRDVDLSHDLKSDKKKNEIKPCNIAIVQLKIESIKPFFPWINDEKITKKREFVKKRIFEYIDKLLKEDPKPDIIVFPEMTIMEGWIDEIKKKIETHEVIIVAGSHLKKYSERKIDKNKYYNVCPFIVSDGKGHVLTYEIYKNNTRSQMEEDIEKKHGIKFLEGEGMLRFINTGFGNIGVLVCSDFYINANISDLLLDKIDILIVPSWNEGIETFRENATTRSDEKSCFILIVNESNIGGESGLYARYHGEEKKKLKDKRMHFKKGYEGYETYLVDALQIDFWRNEELRKILTDKDKKQIEDLLNKIKDADMIERLKGIPKKFNKNTSSAKKPLHDRVWPKEIKDYLSKK